MSAVAIQPSTKHMIDCDADPFVSEDWAVEEHQKGGIFAWEASRVELYLTSDQTDGKVIEGNKLRKELAKKPVLNASILHYLFLNQQLIPEEWKRNERSETRIFFWGTIYRGRGGDLYVSYLYFPNEYGWWDWGYSELDYVKGSGDYAAVRAG